MRIVILDINDNFPEFAHSFYVFNVSEEQGPRYPVGTLEVRCGDDGRKG